jgi:predicted CoA-binding protein
MTMDQTVKDFIQLKRIAVVGVSRSGKKFGNTIATELKQRGYQVFIVHPEAKEIGGEPCYPNLAALQGKVDGVLICVPPSQAGQVLQEAAQAGMKKIWLQQGAQSPEVLAQARELGINPVAGKCILMYAEPVRSLHGWHRAFARLFGQL